MRKKQFWSKAGSRVTKRKARISHNCEECFTTISPKQEYYEVSYEGEDFQWHTVRICEDCWEGSPLYARKKDKV